MNSKLKTALETTDAFHKNWMGTKLSKKVRFNKTVKTGAHRGSKYEIIDTEMSDDETTYAVFIENIRTHQMDLYETADFNTIPEAISAAKQAIDYMHRNKEEY